MTAHEELPPSVWVRRWTPLIPRGGRVLDLACGRGRHARLLAAQGFDVVAVDRDPEALASMSGIPRIETRLLDLENAPWPFSDGEFAGIVVANYLHRPLVRSLVAALATNGALIYETFAAGNERYGRPSNPDFLLRRGELLDMLCGALAVVAFEEGFVWEPRAAVVSRVCAVKTKAPQPLGHFPVDSSRNLQ